MKQKKCFIGEIWVLFLFAFLCVGSVLWTAQTVQAKDQIKVRVGYSNSEFISADSKNSYQGYGYELLRMIAQYEPLKYEYVFAPPMKLRQMLKDGEIDLLAPVCHTEKLNQDFDFTSLSIGSSQLVISARENSNLAERIYTERLVIGMVKGTTAEKKLLKQYCRQNGIDAAIKEYESFNMLKDELKRSSIDAVFTDRWDINGYQFLARFGTRDLYFAVQKGNTELLDYLDDGLERVESDWPEYRQTLYERFYAQNDITGTVLRAEEKAFIEETDEVVVAVPGNVQPLHYEMEDGSFAGIHIRVLDTIAENTGLSFHYVNAGNMDEAVAMLRDNTADILCGIVDSVSWAENNGLILTSSYMDNVLVIARTEADIRKENDAREKNRSILAVYNDNIQLSGYFSNSSLFCDSLEACFSAVESGEADFTFGNIYAVETLKLKAKYRDFSVSHVAGNGGKFCFAMLNEDDSTLYHIINKMVKVINSDLIDSFMAEETLNQKAEFSLSGYIYEHTMAVIILVLVVAAAIVLFAVRSMKRGNTLEKGFLENYMLLQNSYHSLMEISGDCLFEYNTKIDLMRFSKSMSERFGIGRECKNFKKFHQAEQKVHPDDIQVLMELEESLIQKKIGEKVVQCRIDCGEQGYKRMYLSAAAICDSNGKVELVVGRVFDESTKLTEKQQESTFSGIYSYLEIKDMILHTLEGSGDRDKHVMIVMSFDNSGDNFIDHEQESLLRAAQCIQSCVRTTDIIGRCGDNQLLLFMRQIQSRKQIENKLDRIKYLLKEEFYSDDIGLTVGYSVYPMQGSNYEELYEKAVSGISAGIAYNVHN